MQQYYPYTIVRDCIVVNGKKYCEVSDIAMRDFGFILLGIALAVAWCVAGVLLVDEVENQGRFMLCWFGIPPMLAIAALIIFGG